MSVRGIVSEQQAFFPLSRNKRHKYYDDTVLKHVHLKKWPQVPLMHLWLNVYLVSNIPSFLWSTVSKLQDNVSRNAPNYSLDIDVSKGKVNMFRQKIQVSERLHDGWIPSKHFPCTEIKLENHVCPCCYMYMYRLTGKGSVWKRSVTHSQIITKCVKHKLHWLDIMLSIGANGERYTQITAETSHSQWSLILPSQQN